MSSLSLEHREVLEQRLIDLVPNGKVS